MNSLFSSLTLDELTCRVTGLRGLGGIYFRRVALCKIQMNGHLVLFLVLEHSSGQSIDKSRKEWIRSAIQTRNLNFLRILNETTRPFITQAKEFLELAAGIENNMPIMQYLISLNCLIDPFKAMLSAVKNKAFNNLQWLERNGFPIENSFRLIEMAAGTENNIPMIKYLISKKCPISHFYTLQSASKNGALNNLKWLLKNEISIDDRGKATRGCILNMKNWVASCISAKENDDTIKTIEWFKEQGFSSFAGLGDTLSLDKRRWLMKIRCEAISHLSVFAKAARHGSLENLKWLLENGCPINNFDILTEAAAHGSLENMQWLVENGCPINNFNILREAAAQGSLENIKWLVENGCPINNFKILREAAAQGSLENIQWLVENGCPIDNREIFIAAVRFGSIEQMEWLLENGCPIGNLEIFEEAAKTGNLQVMRWLLANGCPIDSYIIFVRAAGHGSLQNMKWLLANGCPINNCNIFEEAAEFGSLHNMKWLLANGCPINHSDTLAYAAKYGSLVNMKWLVANGCHIRQCNSQILAEAGIFGSLPNMKWLLENGCSIDDNHTFDQVLYGHGSLRILRWLLENGCPVVLQRENRKNRVYGSFENILQLLEISPERASSVARRRRRFQEPGRYDMVYYFAHGRKFRLSGTRKSRSSRLTF